MTRRLFSPSWHSVASLKPRLAPQARVYRHVYRGRIWYVVQDPTAGQYHRLTPAAYELVNAMNGERTVQAIWEQSNQRDEAEICTQNEVVDLLVRLHTAELLQVDTTPDSLALFERYRKKRGAVLRQWLINPLSVKIPLVDPHAFLDRWAPRLAGCFGRAGMLVWLAVVLPALVLAAQHLDELTSNFSDRALSTGNLLVIALVYPVVKLLHELGHAVATRVWGGTVHEMGLMFLVFAPVPYVNASASTAFASKYRRALVAAAGMVVELFLAALALYVWLAVEPGVVRAVAFNLMLIAGI
jgi:putative peptide zinc metalloprotease protein